LLREMRLVAALSVMLAPALAAQRQPIRTIAVGVTVQGRLQRSDVLLARDSTYAQEWRIDAVRGQVVTVDLASGAFDAYLIVYGSGIATQLQDDDSGGSCNARLIVRFPESGAYYIAVTSTEKFETGPFSLRITSGAKPTLLSRCTRAR
jgi:hypothetical protein